MLAGGGVIAPMLGFVEHGTVKQFADFVDEFSRAVARGQPTEGHNYNNAASQQLWNWCFQLSKHEHRRHYFVQPYAYQSSRP